ncbi:sulfotransferase domain-containing protein [Micromonospora auratinigra]|uniref:Sulfotransferase domain-containing protein n=1 Tax=Micromonospora auratinigra TaxID=261654 RepID=A0A1A9AB12_9ACTN|nr:sulfotransferase domain-containing protein [Micromonospora auratinigra]SBT53293.1 Sulfotransferase domain-containing protein [Micromonospora auratinigra]
MPAPQRHVSGISDSSRWDGFPFRPDDIVLSTPSKCGTTWAQMICALLIFGGPELPAPLTALSPWLDMRLRPLDEVRHVLDRQTHRRFIKTHTPLDGLPVAPGVTYLVVGRDPRDVAVSMSHHRGNLDDAVIRRLLPPAGPAPDRPRPPRPSDPRLRVLQWLDEDLAGLVQHLADAWDRRHDEQVVLLHYADLSRDLAGQMRRLAGRLGIDVPECRWPDLVRAATFSEMRGRADRLAPDEGLGLFADPDRFFHSGTTGQWRDLLTAADEAHYQRRLAALAPAELRHWLHHGTGAS